MANTFFFPQDTCSMSQLHHKGILTYIGAFEIMHKSNHIVRKYGIAYSKIPFLIKHEKTTITDVRCILKVLT